MNKTKRIAVIAIIAALPFAVNATTRVGPVGDAESGFVVATDGYPYVSVESTRDDESHIATTAYVKGAYNDAVAAINKLGEVKQDILYFVDKNGNPVVADSRVLGSLEVADIIREGGEDNYLMTSKAVVDTIDGKVNNKRVKIYTTWDTADTTQVTLDNVQ